ncbi:Response regulator receiver domain-containing protein [Tistlia consotensis]|uniref:Two-component system, OmpR family, response regulator MprA n=1 Tax=Tistlia consotensis USBA 355 TaxID=560819 RepID=A0A1Y6BM31_9PROT|nr:response regulator [Tistlia consotensis]SMF18913.1 two-component system, OmpR family, response regulator MprA [Tistlia consotensis USBA 355]SNR39320.1 Response regulator receiver domain-containing protein [Tistlia consotensis]
MTGYPYQRSASDGLAGAPCRPTVLVIDDDPDMRALIAATLESAGYQVLTSENGREAVATLIETPVDLVITDLFMPEFDGLEVIRAIRDCADHLPILAISGSSAYVTMDYLPIAHLLGADAVLPKPFPIKVLEQQVRDLLPGCCEAAPRSANDN